MLLGSQQLIVCIEGYGVPVGFGGENVRKNA